MRIKPGDNALITFLVLGTAITILRWPFAWTGNEENYFLLAHRLVEPHAYGPFDAVFDSSRGKWLGLLSFGWMVKLFGFEAAHKLLGALTVALTAAGFTALASMLRLGTLSGLSLLLLFVALGQSFAGGEWFVGAVETKALAYGFGLLAVPAANAGRIRLAAIFVALSGYWHFLVGGFWFCAVIIFVAFQPERRKGVALLISVTVLLLLPLIAVLGFEVYSASNLPVPRGMPDADTIYSIIRAPHHVAPFDGPHPWFKKAIASAFLGLLMAPAAWVAASRTGDAGLHALLRTLSVALLILPMALLASWFDRHQGVLGKFYLFRPASPLLLLCLFAWAAFFQQWLVSKSWSRLIWVGLAVCSLGYMRARPHYFWPEKDEEFGPLVAAVRAHTGPEQVVLVDPELDNLGGNSLTRKLGRPVFVSWKFVPTNPADIYTWYDRIMLRRALFVSGCPTNPRVGALIVANEDIARKARCGDRIYSDSRMTVLAMRDRSVRPRASVLN